MNKELIKRIQESRKNCETCKHAELDRLDDYPCNECFRNPFNRDYWEWEAESEQNPDHG